MKHNDILKLIAAFEAGETSVAEERRLFAAFARSKRIAPELEPYREMMQWYASLHPAEAVTPAPRFRRFAPWIGAAAAVAMLVTVGVGYINRLDALPDDYAMYRGSYVIRNGVKCTDLAQILPEVKRVEQIVSGQQQAVARGVAQSSSRTSLYEGIDMDDPMVAEVINRIYSE